jgi:hypothetical protein
MTTTKTIREILNLIDKADYIEVNGITACNMYVDQESNAHDNAFDFFWSTDSDDDCDDYGQLFSNDVLNEIKIEKNFITIGDVVIALFFHAPLLVK